MIFSSNEWSWEWEWDNENEYFYESKYTVEEATVDGIGQCPIPSTNGHQCLFTFWSTLDRKACDHANDMSYACEFDREELDEEKKTFTFEKNNF